METTAFTISTRSNLKEKRSEDDQPEVSGSEPGAVEENKNTSYSAIFITRAERTSKSHPISAHAAEELPQETGSGTRPHARATWKLKITDNNITGRETERYLSEKNFRVQAQKNRTDLFIGALKKNREEKEYRLSNSRKERRLKLNNTDNDHGPGHGSGHTPTHTPGHRPGRPRRHTGTHTRTPLTSCEVKNPR